LAHGLVVLRWSICALLFFATTINYIDRQVLGILSKDLQGALHWSEIDYGNIVAAFNAAYALGLLVVGRLIDRFGTKIGYSAALIIWSIAAMAHALARSAFGFGVARAALGVGESGNFPAATQNDGGVVSQKGARIRHRDIQCRFECRRHRRPAYRPLDCSSLGLAVGFILTGAIGLLWLAFWIPLYAKPEMHSRLSKAELDHIQSDPPDQVGARVPWIKLIPHRQTSAFAIGKYLTDPIWWFYLYWIPTSCGKITGSICRRLVCR
jgi:ACS family hexuronate transporter-like MFS transporter